MLKNEVRYSRAVSQMQIKENNAVVLSSLDNNDIEPRPSYKDYEPRNLS